MQCMHAEARGRQRAALCLQANAHFWGRWAPFLAVFRGNVSKVLTHLAALGALWSVNAWKAEAWSVHAGERAVPGGGG